MTRITAICPNKPPTKKEIKERLAMYERDLASCRADLKKRYKNGNAPGMPNAVKILRNECRRRIAYYVPAIEELKYVLGIDEEFEGSPVKVFRAQF